MNAEIFQAIWSRSAGPGLPYLGFIQRPSNLFRDTPFSNYDEADWPEQIPGQDYFFTPRLFVGARKNESATPTSILFADLDNYRDSLDPLHKIWPHILWKTSNANAQAIWFLRSEISDGNAWAKLNQSLTYFMGADKGGWHASKLLRVPGSTNFKYDPPQQSMVISYQPTAAPYEAEALRANLPSVEQGGVASTQHPDPIEREEWKAHLATIWAGLPLSVRSDLLAPGMRDRSRAIVAMVNKLTHLGIMPVDIFQAIWWTQWNKWRTDRHNPEYLWQLINH